MNRLANILSFFFYAALFPAVNAEAQGVQRGADWLIDNSSYVSQVVESANGKELSITNGKDWDGILHVNPHAREKGLLMLYNPLGSKIVRVLDVPVYYTGLTDRVHLKDSNGRTSVAKVSRDYHARVRVEIPARGWTYRIMN